MPLPAIELLVDFGAAGFTAATTEAGSPARGVGQWTNFNSCTISNTAVADRVQIGCAATATDFAFVIQLAPTNANNGAGQPAHGTILDWRASSNEKVECWYDKSNARWQLDVTHGGSTQSITLADTWTANASKVLYLAGSSTLISLGKDGGAFTTAARTQTPTGLPATVDVGSVAAATQFEATYASVTVCNVALDATQWADLAALTRPPLFGERIGRAMVDLWYGKDTTYLNQAQAIVGPELYAWTSQRGRDYASQLTGRSVAGRLSATLRNADGRYSPSNASSPLTGLILPKRTVRLRMADATKHYDVWYGFLTRIQPAAGLPATATLEASGALWLMGRTQINPQRNTGALTGTIVTAILAAAGWAGATNIDAGKTTCGPWAVSNIDALSALKDMEETEMGFLKEGRAGSIDYEDHQHRLLTAVCTTPQATYTDAVGGALQYAGQPTHEDAMKEIFNDVQVQVQHFTTGAVAVLWTYAGASIVIAPGGTYTFTAVYPSDGTASRTASYVDAWSTPVVGTDITQTGVANGDLAVTTVKSANQMQVTVTNNNTTASATLTLAQAQGTPVTAATPTTVEASDATSIAAYVKSTYKLPGEYIATELAAADYANFLVSRYKDPHPALTLPFAPTLSAAQLAEALARDISDRVSVVATGIRTEFGLSEDFYVESIKHTSDAQRNLQTVMTLSPVAGDGGYWIVGSSALGTTTKVGY